MPMVLSITYRRIKTVDTVAVIHLSIYNKWEQTLSTRRYSARLTRRGRTRPRAGEETTRGRGPGLWRPGWAEGEARAWEIDLGRLWPASRKGGGGPLSAKLIFPNSIFKQISNISFQIPF
jgi:hypothetical protein